MQYNYTYKAKSEISSTFIHSVLSHGYDLFWFLVLRYVIQPQRQVASAHSHFPLPILIVWRRHESLYGFIFHSVCR